jgi:hypothetical protein
MFERGRHKNNFVRFCFFLRLSHAFTIPQKGKKVKIFRVPPEKARKLEPERRRGTE